MIDQALRERKRESRRRRAERRKAARTVKVQGEAALGALKVGDKLVAHGIACMRGGPYTVKRDRQGLYVECSGQGGRHDLDLHPQDAEGRLKGLTKK